MKYEGTINWESEEKYLPHKTWLQKFTPWNVHLKWTSQQDIVVYISKYRTPIQGGKCR